MGAAAAAARGARGLRGGTALLLSQLPLHGQHSIRLVQHGLRSMGYTQNMGCKARGALRISRLGRRGAPPLSCRCTHTLHSPCQKLCLQAPAAAAEGFFSQQEAPTGSKA